MQGFVSDANEQNFDRLDTVLHQDAWQVIIGTASSGTLRWQGYTEGTSMSYVDGFVIPIPKKNVKTYLAIARKAAKVWCEHGALEYRECIGEDLDTHCGMPFPTLLKLKPGETAIFAWIVYKSRAHRDKVNASVMNDPRIAAMMDPKDMPFDDKRMAFGGFRIMVKR